MIGYFIIFCLFVWKNCNKCNQTFTILLSYSRLTKASLSIGTVPLANSIWRAENITTHFLSKPHEEKSSSSVLTFCLTALYFYFLVLRTATLSKSRLYNIKPTEIKYNVRFHSWQTQFQTLLFRPRPLFSKLIWRNDNIYLSCLIHEPVSRL